MSRHTDCREDLRQRAERLGYPSVSARRLEVAAGPQAWEQFVGSADYFALGRVMAAVGALELRQRQLQAEQARV